MTVNSFALNNMTLAHNISHPHRQLFSAASQTPYIANLDLVISVLLH